MKKAHLDIQAIASELDSPSEEYTYISGWSWEVTPWSNNDDVAPYGGVDYDVEVTVVIDNIYDILTQNGIKLASYTVHLLPQSV